VSAEATPQDAATVVLLRNGPRGRGPLEVLLLERPPHAAFAPGATVFPGGRVESADRDPGWLARCRAEIVDPRAPLAVAIAAIRECFEETGLLLAIDPRGRAVGRDHTGALATLRRRLLAGDASALREGLNRLGLRPAVASLVFCAHWITPAGLPRRYDTRFYLARAPEEEARGAETGGESVRWGWTTPAAALEHGRTRAWQILPPTRAVLAGVGAHRTCAEALAAARTAPVVTVRPELADVTPARVPGLDPAVLLGADGG